jgi:hypothetical protein
MILPRFHDELGRLDAREGHTKLFDAIQHAAKQLIHYKKENAIPDSVPMRIFALTDGEDNASTESAWKVTQFLQVYIYI